MHLHPHADACSCDAAGMLRFGVASCRASPGEPVGEEVYVLLDLEPLGAEHTLQTGSVIELSVRVFENVSLVVCGRTSEKQKGSSKTETLEFKICLKF